MTTKRIKCETCLKTFLWSKKTNRGRPKIFCGDCYKTRLINRGRWVYWKVPGFREKSLLWHKKHHELTYKSKLIDIKKTCVKCGKKFITKYKSKKYCTDKCQYIKYDPIKLQ